MPSLWKCFNVNKICKDSTTKQDQQFYAMNNIHVHRLNISEVLLSIFSIHVQGPTVMTIHCFKQLLYRQKMTRSIYYTMPLCSVITLHKTKTYKNFKKEMKQSHNRQFNK